MNFSSVIDFLGIIWGYFEKLFLTFLKWIGLFYLFIILISVMVLAPLFMIDVAVSSFPSSENDLKFNTLYFLKDSFEFQLETMHQMRMIFAASLGSIGGAINAFHLVIRKIDLSDTTSSLKDYSLSYITAFMITLIMRMIVGSGLGILAMLFIGSGLIASVFEGGGIEGINVVDLKPKSHVIGALALIFGLFSNKVIDRVGSRIGS